MKLNEILLESAVHFVFCVDFLPLLKGFVSSKKKIQRILEKDFFDAPVESSETITHTWIPFLPCQVNIKTKRCSTSVS